MKMPTPVPAASLPAVAALALFIAGCNEGPSVGGNDADPHAPGTFAVTGSATYEGRPIDGEAVFTPADGGEAITVPVENGSYELKAAPGKYEVAITGKAGEAELPAGLSVERDVRPDTAGQALTITLPEANPQNHDTKTPGEVRELPVSGSDAE